MKGPELLSPAGSLEALRAAVWAGADAVYFGGKAFNARAFADNFGDTEMAEAFSLCRLYGVKVYLVLNTLLADDEFSAALEFVDLMEKSYIPDAYIVQDLGLIKALKRKYPDLPIHASTQMQQHGYCAEYLKDLGVSRVVLAREASCDDIRAVVETGIETEVFVHGAICVCQSGGCLMSSVIGGRSGNRGRCAQPCRQSYNGSYPLSLKDMCLANHIPRLAEIGVTCLKIEGRMKSPEYVYKTVSVYRRLLDENRPATPKEIKELSEAFSRSGFTDGYFTGKLGKNMFGIRTEDDKEKSRSAEINIVEKKIETRIHCVLRTGAPMYITASVDGCLAEVYGPVPQAAKSHALTAEELSARLSKTGGTPFSATVTVDIDEGLNLPISQINALRRDALSALSEKLTEKNRPLPRAALDVTENEDYTYISKGKKYYVARFEGAYPPKKVLDKALSLCDRVELPLWCSPTEQSDVDKISLVLPRVIFPKDKSEIVRLIKKAYDNGVRHLTVSNPSHLDMCKGFTVHGDYSLNFTNSHTGAALKAMGFDTIAVSPEVPPRRIKKMPTGAEFCIYGRTPLMHTETCIISNVSPCKNENVCRGCLKDKTGAIFPVMREYRHRNVIYNSVPVYLADQKEKVAAVDGYVLFFTDESEQDMQSAIEACLKGTPPEGGFTRGALKRSGGAFDK